MYKKQFGSIPVKFWTDPELITNDDTLQQIKNLSNLSFAFKHIAIMPDVHLGYGMPVGGVLATEDAIVPDAVGVDISCGMRFASLSIDGLSASEVLHKDTPNGVLGKAILNQLQRNIKVGVGGNYNKCHYPNKSDELADFFHDKFKDQSLHMSKEKIDELFIETAPMALGTLGSGNHFVEIQEDVETSDIGLMIHTGSRGFGYKIAKFYNEYAKEKNKKWKSDIPTTELSFLPAHSDIGQEYYKFTKVADKFAELNREIIMQEFITATKEILDRFGINNYNFGKEIKCHHNFVDIENHFGQNVYVHRKGAIRARGGDRGIIPGAMGSYSYIVTGKGNKQSFTTASHGAGRTMGRNEAKRTFDVQDMMEEFYNNDMFLVTDNKKDTLDEYRKAYKNIEDVIKYQDKLIDIDRKMLTVGVLKG